MTIGDNCRFCLDHYRGYHISYWAKPIPVRHFDYDFVHDDYDGGDIDYDTPSRDRRHGSAASIEQARERIDEIEDERE